MGFGDALKFVAGAALIVGGTILGGPLGLVYAGASVIASTAIGMLGTEARQQGMQTEVTSTSASMPVIYGKARVAAHVPEDR